MSFFRTNSQLKRSKLLCSATALSFDAPSLRNPRLANVHRYLVFLETRIIVLQFDADSRGLSSFRFFWTFSATLCFGHSGSSKVSDFGPNRKRICDFLLHRHRNFDPILHCFIGIAGFCAHDPTPISPNFGGVPFPLDQIALVEVNLSRNLKLISRENIFKVFQPVWKTYVNITDNILWHNCTLWNIAL